MMSIVFNKKPSASVADLEVKFLKMLVMRLADPENTYRSSYDLEAIKRFNEAHTQDSEDVEVADLAVAEFSSMNPHIAITD